MKLPAIFQNNALRSGGFLVFEALVALTLATLLIPAALELSWSNGRLFVLAQSEIGSTTNIADLIENGVTYQIASSSRLYQHEFGRSTCSLVPQDSSKGFVAADIYVSGVGSAVGGFGTDLAAHNGFVYETTEPASNTSPDFFIVDDRNPLAPVTVSSFVAGLGLAAVSVSGYYAYVANESAKSQLRVLDIHDRMHPAVVSQMKLPLPDASATGPFASSIFYDNGLVYLGTQKWDGNEMNIIDVSNPAMPLYVSGFQTDTLVNSIYENGGYVYAALPATNAQMDIFDARNPHSIMDISHFAPAGSAVLEGKAFAYDSGVAFETANAGDASGTLYFARSGGGFDNTSQYELFSFNLARDPYGQNPVFSRDIPGGVYGVVYSAGYVFLATGDPSAGFQIWKSDFSKEVYSSSLPAKPVSLLCDHNRLYAALSSPAGFAAIVPH
jgi:hypothetical protein